MGSLRYRGTALLNLYPEVERLVSGHGSSRALIQVLLFYGLPLWKCNFTKADFGIQAQ
jgi:hypothetical protein